MIWRWLSMSKKKKVFKVVYGDQELIRLVNEQMSLDHKKNFSDESKLLINEGYQNYNKYNTYLAKAKTNNLSDIVYDTNRMVCELDKKVIMLLLLGKYIYLTDANSNMLFKDYLKDENFSDVLSRNDIMDCLSLDYKDKRVNEVVNKFTNYLKETNY